MIDLRVESRYITKPMACKINWSCWKKINNFPVERTDSSYNHIARPK